MVAINDFRDELRMKAHNVDNDIKKINRMVEQKRISKIFGEYAMYLRALDYLSDEVIVFGRNGFYDNAKNSLDNMKFQMYKVAGILMSNNDCEKECIGNVSNYEKYGELFNFAQQKYDDTLSKLEEIRGIIKL
jgi:hypothetical protein